MESAQKARIIRACYAVIAARNSGEASRVSATVLALAKLATAEFAAKVAMANRDEVVRALVQLRTNDRHDVAEALMFAWASDWD